MLFDKIWKKKVEIVSTPVKVENLDDLVEELERLAYLAVAKKFSHQNEYIISQVKALRPYLSMDWSWLTDRELNKGFLGDSGWLVAALKKRIKTNDETIARLKKSLDQLTKVYADNAYLNERIIELEQALREVGKKYSERNGLLAQTVRAQEQLFNVYVAGRPVPATVYKVIKEAKEAGVDFSPLEG